METETRAGNEDELDAQAQLAMLASVQDATEIEGWMPPTPVWHAPLLATAVAGGALLNSTADVWPRAGAIIGGIALIIGVSDQLRRQRVIPRRTKKPLRILAFYGFAMIVTFVIAGLWFMIDWPADLAPRVLTLLGAWLTTTLVFALGITTTNWARNSWAESAR